MPRQTPPFRADMVGSLLRTALLKAARAQHEQAAITAGELQAIENQEIRKIVRRQEEIGLQAVTDGEFRRAFWHFDFLEHLDGVEGYWADHGIQFQGAKVKPSLPVTRMPLGFSWVPWNCTPWSAQ